MIWEVFLPLCLVLVISCYAAPHDPKQEGAINDDDIADKYHDGPIRHHVSSVFNDRDWFAEGQDELRRSLLNGLNIGLAKNVILFVGDGMGVTTTSAARFYKSQTRGQTGREANFAWDHFAHSASSKTYSTDEQIADSASTATAILCGEKARYGVVGVNQKVIRRDCASSIGNHIKSILQYAIEANKWTGIVTNARITHATPAAAYAHTPNRSWETDYDMRNYPDAQGICKDIAVQLVEDNPDIRVIMGGGRRSFYPDTEEDPEYGTAGRRRDGRNLVREWIAEKELRPDVSADQVKYVISQAEFDDVDPDKTEYLMGLFEDTHMQYETDRPNDRLGEPSLAEMTEKAIKMLQRSENGFFLEVEGGRIDLAHHSNRAFRALNETVALSDAVQVALDMTSSEDTLIVITADHSHVMTFNGYSTIDNDILGLAGSVDENGNRDELEEGDDDKPYSTLSYTNGPGWDFHREDDGYRRDLTSLDEEIGSNPTFRYDAAFPKGTETHGGEDVQIFANGPMSYLFHGTHEQNYIAHVMMYASCLGPNTEHCDKPWDYPGCPEDRV